MARLKVLLLSLIAIVTLAGAVPVAHGQIVINTGHRRYHRHYRHHRHYRR